MTEKELEFSRIVKANKNAIFTVCYLFSKEHDEVNDLFQETLINALWLVLVGVVCLAYYWGTVRGVIIFCYCIIFDIILASFYYVIDDVFVKPDVENTLESILKDLES